MRAERERGIPALGFCRYIISATAPFLPSDLAGLRRDAPLVARRFLAHGASFASGRLVGAMGRHAQWGQVRFRGFCGGDPKVEPGHDNEQDDKLTVPLSSRPGQYACFHLFLDHCEIFRKTIAEHCSDNGFAPSITCYKAPFFSAPLNICEQMRRAEVAHKIEMHPENLAGTGRDTFKFLPLASAQIRSGCETL